MNIYVSIKLFHFLPPPSYGKNCITLRSQLLIARSTEEDKFMDKFSLQKVLEAKKPQKWVA
jgi:hypothetical protein